MLVGMSDKSDQSGFPEDVKAVARSVLAHRITVRPELWMTEASGARVVEQVLGTTPTPATLEGYRRP